MIRRITAKAAIRAMGNGASRPWLMKCDDGYEYVIKFRLPQSKAMANELIAGMIARHLDLPAPKMALVDVPEYLMEPDMGREGSRAGLHVGVRMLNDVDDFTDLHTRDVIDLINGDELYGVVCFDNWMYNIDRRNDGNNLIETRDKVHKYWMLDFEGCFGREWTVDKLESLRLSGPVRMFPFIEKRITDTARFDPWLEKIEGVNAGPIRGAVDAVPEDWLGAAERQALEDFLTHRRYHVRKIIFGRRI